VQVRVRGMLFLQMCPHGGESLATENREHNHWDNTFNYIESDAKTVVNWIHLQGCELNKKVTIRAPRTGLSFTSACLSTVDLTVGAIGELKEGVEVEEDGEDDHQDHISPAPPHVMPDGLVVGDAYVEVALQGDGHQGEGATGEGNLEKGIGVDNEGRAVVGLEVRGEGGCRVVGETCCQGEDVEEREEGEQIGKSWSEVETLTTAEQDRDADQIAYDA